MKLSLQRTAGNLPGAAVLFSVSRRMTNTSPTDTTSADPIGVYVHFPYCLKKCPYCDFASYTTPRDEVPHARYADAVLLELAQRKHGLSDRHRLSSIFFGGGTPSLWDAKELGRVVAGVKDAFPSRADDLEVTAECNPTSLDEARAAALLEAGVNRASIGIQSLSTERLEFLGRLHGANDGLRAVREARRAGFQRISGDLIFGVEGGRPQQPAEAAQEAEALAAEGLDHVSAYGLTIEPGTRFGELHRKGKLPVASDDAVVESFFAVEEVLERAGLRHYEISNYAREGQEARHNLGYWNGHDYLGLGSAAVGTLSQPSGDAVRRKNDVDPNRYMRASLEGGAIKHDDESLDPETRLRERIMLGLRLEAGIDLGLAGRSLGVEAFTDERTRAIRRLSSRGQLEVVGERLRVTKRARALTDGIAAALF
jgi:putative oxygen-independent coproporphyrinogen III oxidase